MRMPRYVLYTLVVVFLLVLVTPLHAQTADGSDVKVIYQTTFSDDPRWITNNPSTDYWDPSRGMYHFSIEPSTGSYAYADIEYDEGSFTLEYDLLLTRIDEGATFRFGISGAEMDFNKGPNIVTMFTNAKYGKIMWLHLVTPGAKVLEANSQHEATELGPGAYSGPTVKYEVNKTYHVSVNYDDERKTASMKVTERTTGKDVWGYYLNSWENLDGMKRIYLGSKGDYGQMYLYAQGYIDNVRLTAPQEVTPTQTTVIPVSTVPKTPTKKPTTRQTVVAPTPLPTETPQSQLSPVPVICALGIAGICGGICRMRRNR
jgi:hypothetical protein